MRPYPSRSRLRSSWGSVRTERPSIIPSQALDWTVRTEFSPNSQEQLLDFALGNARDAQQVGVGVVAGWIAWRKDAPCQQGSLYAVDGLPFPVYVRVSGVAPNEKVLTVQVLAP